MPSQPGETPTVRPPSLEPRADREWIACRVVEAPNSGDLAWLDEHLARAFVSRSPTRPELKGVGAYRDYMRRHRVAFPDFRVDIAEAFTSGETVVVRWTASGTHRGDFFGIRPTGTSVCFTGITICYFHEQLITGMWVQSDALTLFRQLGAVTEKVHAVR